MTNDKEILIMQYKELCNLHQFYLKMVFTSALFVNGVISGFVAYVLANLVGNDYLILALIFPIFISLSYSFILFKAKPKCEEFKQAIDNIVKEVDIDIGPHVSLTIDSISVFIPLYFLYGIGLLVVLLLRCASIAVPSLSLSYSFAS